MAEYLSEQYPSDRILQLYEQIASAPAYQETCSRIIISPEMTIECLANNIQSVPMIIIQEDTVFTKLFIPPYSYSLSNFCLNPESVEFDASIRIRQKLYNGYENLYPLCLFHEIVELWHMFEPRHAPFWQELLEGSKSVWNKNRVTKHIYWYIKSFRDYNNREHHIALLWQFHVAHKVGLADKLIEWVYNVCDSSYIREHYMQAYTQSKE